MSESTEVTSSGETKAAAQPAAPRAVSWMARLSLTQLTLIVVVVLFVWQWFDSHYQLNQMQQQVAGRLSEVEASNKANQVLQAQNQELVRELGGKLSLLENRYAETQNQRAALESLYQEMSSSRDQMALAEVEQMLLIAGQQLQLSGNVKAALIAMQQAESRLQRPAFAALKSRVEQDIGKLRAVPRIDVPAINQRLDGVIGSVESLGLLQDKRVQAQAESAVETNEGWWKRFWREFWQETRHLVRIENTGRQELPLLSPDQTFFLRENLKLRLLSARMALLTHDEVSFRREMKMSQEWLQRYFDLKSGKGEQVLDSVQKLATSSIVINLPDISGSLEAVRNYRVAHERSPK